MSKVVKTICPLCKNTITASIYSDRSVGIFFDYEVIEEETNCTCDVDDDFVQLDIFAKLCDEFKHLV
jgi:hypothetical protein